MFTNVRRPASLLSVAFVLVLSACEIGPVIEPLTPEALAVIPPAAIEAATITVAVVSPPIMTEPVTIALYREAKFYIQGNEAALAAGLVVAPASTTGDRGVAVQSNSDALAVQAIAAAVRGETATVSVVGYTDNQCCRDKIGSPGYNSSNITIAGSVELATRRADAAAADLRQDIIDTGGKATVVDHNYQCADVPTGTVCIVSQKGTEANLNSRLRGAKATLTTTASTVTVRRMCVATGLPEPCPVTTTVPPTTPPTTVPPTTPPTTGPDSPPTTGPDSPPTTGPDSTSPTTNSGGSTAPTTGPGGDNPSTTGTSTVPAPDYCPVVCPSTSAPSTIPSGPSGPSETVITNILKRLSLRVEVSVPNKYLTRGAYAWQSFSIESVTLLCDDGTPCSDADPASLARFFATLSLPSSNYFAALVFTNNYDSCKSSTDIDCEYFIDPSKLGIQWTSLRGETLSLNALFAAFRTATPTGSDVRPTVSIVRASVSIRIGAPGCETDDCWVERPLPMSAIQVFTTNDEPFTNVGSTWYVARTVSGTIGSSRS